jgi:protease PrsW
METNSSPVLVISKPRKILWLKTFVIALVFFLIGIGILFFSKNSNLFPPVVMVGCFMVPISYVAFFYERRHLSELRMPTMVLTFFYGGFIGVFAASLLEPLVIHKLTFLSSFEAGLIEEFVKVLGVFLISRGKCHDTELDGIILGAVAGMSFAALESTGYAFTAFLSSHGDLSATLLVVLVRGVLSPLGHGTWTAILAGILFRESNYGRFHLNLKVFGAYALVVILHGLWNSLPTSISHLTGSSFFVVVVEVLIGSVGLTILYFLWRDGVRRLMLLEEPKPFTPTF